VRCLSGHVGGERERECRGDCSRLVWLHGASTVRPQPPTLADGWWHDGDDDNKTSHGATRHGGGIPSTLPTRRGTCPRCKNASFTTHVGVRPTYRVHTARLHHGRRHAPGRARGGADATECRTAASTLAEPFISRHGVDIQSSDSDWTRQPLGAATRRCRRHRHHSATNPAGR
jgi:hypothetical protein